MTRRSYGQYCALARTLDLIGERWTLLVLRELVAGPKRYTDILNGLPGMNPTLLAQRLRDLQRDGIVERKELAPPAASVVYDLTAVGDDLVGAMLPLVAWGARHALGKRRKDEVFRLEWALLAVRESLDRSKLKDFDATYEFRVDGSVAWMVFDEGRIDVLTSPPVYEPDVVLTADLESFVGVGTRQVEPATAIASGRMAVSGTPESVARFAEIMTVPDFRTGALTAERAQESAACSARQAVADES